MICEIPDCRFRQWTALKQPGVNKGALAPDGYRFIAAGTDLSSNRLESHGDDISAVTILILQITGQTFDQEESQVGLIYIRCIR
jgi:hypothetical protein